jgi:hypothetical protein
VPIGTNLDREFLPSAAGIMNSSSLPNCFANGQITSVHAIRMAFEAYLVEAVAYGP